MVWHVDNNTAPLVKPRKKPVYSKEVRYFTDEIGETPSVPQADWFNMVQGELIQLARDLGVSPDKLNDGQLGPALKKKLEEISTTISALPKVINALGSSPKDAASQKVVNDVNIAASNAQKTANAANDKANQANVAAGTADGKAVKAQNTANTAVTNAKTADGKAVAAQTAAEQAKTASIGFNQSWLHYHTDNSRIPNVTYRNTTNKPIMVSVTVGFNSGNNSAGFTMTINGFAMARSLTRYGDNEKKAHIALIVPPGQTYLITEISGTVQMWSELGERH